MLIAKNKIYDQLYEACNDLRGSLEPQRYKKYVLILLFVKGISGHCSGDENWNIVVPKGGSFDDIAAMKHRENIGEVINVVLRRLAEANGLDGTVDIADFSSEELGRGSEAVDRLSCLVEIFQNLGASLSNGENDRGDFFREAYEYLLHRFAWDTGSCKEPFYTPDEISIVMAKLIGAGNAEDPGVTIYDPACGSGALLLCAAREAPRGVSLYGQEKNKFTAALARMNLFLHHMDDGVISGGKSTLSSPQFKNAHHSEMLMDFDFIVAHPPFTDKSWVEDIKLPDSYGRYDEDLLGPPSEENGDYAWILHILKSMKPTGRAAVLLPDRVLFSSGINAVIRRKMVDQGYIEGIINLPAGLLYETDDASCILVLDKKGAAERKGIFMIDASQGFTATGDEKCLRKRDIHKIVTTFLAMDVSDPHYACFAANDAIKTVNRYNLYPFYYMESSDHKDLQDINAFINGGIPTKEIDKMAALWKVCPALKNILFQPLRKGYYSLAIQKEAVLPSIMADADFIKNFERVKKAFYLWKENAAPVLGAIDKETNPDKLIEPLSRQLLFDFAEVPLLDKYDIYEALLEYWIDTMRDDVYALCCADKAECKNADGNRAIKSRQPAAASSEFNKDFDRRGQLKALLLKHFYSDVNAVLVILRGKLKEVTDELEKMDRKSSSQPAYRTLQNTEISYKRAIKQTEGSLNTLLEERYQRLNRKEAIQLLAEEKWFPDIYTRIKKAYEAIPLYFSEQLIDMTGRYEYSLKECTDAVEKAEARVKAHLKSLGFLDG